MILRQAGRPPKMEQFPFGLPSANQKKVPLKKRQHTHPYIEGTLVRVSKPTSSRLFLTTKVNLELWNSPLRNPGGCSSLVFWSGPSPRCRRKVNSAGSAWRPSPRQRAWLFSRCRQMGTAQHGGLEPQDRRVFLLVSL